MSVTFPDALHISVSLQNVRCYYIHFQMRKLRPEKLIQLVSDGDRNLRQARNSRICIPHFEMNGILEIV